MSIPTEALRIPMPEVEDFPTDDALRFGKLRTVFLSFAAFGLVVLVVPFTPRGFFYENFIKILIKINFKQTHEQEHAKKTLLKKTCKIIKTQWDFYLFPCLNH